jgi:hypothetical protein
VTEPQNPGPDDRPDGAADTSASSEGGDISASRERNDIPASRERDDVPESAEGEDLPESAEGEDLPESGERDDDPEAADGQVTAALAELDAAAGWPPAEQVAAFGTAHETLQATLARIDDH